jgi:hypothetical protein
MIKPSTWRLSAPNATRIPTSLVRCLTEYDITLYMPAPAQKFVFRFPERRFWIIPLELDKKER